MDESQAIILNSDILVFGRLKWADWGFFVGESLNMEDYCSTTLL